MPLLFWIDIIGLCISILLTGSLTLLAMGFDPKNPVNRSFAFFTGVIALWTVAALFVRLSLWLESVLPFGLFLPNSYLWLAISTVSIVLMCILSLMFAATYLGRRTRYIDFAIAFGLMVLVLFVARSVVRPGASIPDIYFDTYGLVVHKMNPSAKVGFGFFNLYILWSFVLFLQDRHRTGAGYLALSFLILLLGLIFRSFIYTPFPILSFSNAMCAFILAYIVIGKQLFNPLKTRTIQLNKEIEERKKTESLLRESEHRYRLLANNVTDVIWSLDMDLKFTYISPSVEKLRGYTPEEAVKISPDQTFTPASYQKAIQTFSEEIGWDGEPGVSPDRSIVLVLDTVRKDGGVTPVEISTSFIRDETGAPTGIIGITRDITNRKWAEKLLKESEARYRRVAEDTPGLICSFLPGGEITFVNKAYCAYYKKTAEELLGSNFLGRIPKSEKKKR